MLWLEQDDQENTYYAICAELMGSPSTKHVCLFLAHPNISIVATGICNTDFHRRKRPNTGFSPTYYVNIMRSIGPATGRHMRRERAAFIL